MANILEFLRAVLTDGDAQRAFRADPLGHLERSGFADLTGEDVVEGIAVLRRSLPADVGASLEAFAADDEDALPPVRPAKDETELDAAARVLAFAAEQVPLLEEPEPAAAWDEPEPPAEWAAPEPVPVPTVAGDDAAAKAQWAAGAQAPAAEPVAVAAATGGPKPAAGTPIDVGALPSVTAFAESLAAVATDARARSEAALQLLTTTAEEQAAATRAAFDEALRRVVADAETAARATSVRYEELLRQAEADVEGIRAATEAHGAQRRAEGDADREAAAQYLARTQQEADDLLERARDQADELRQRAEELLTRANAEAEAARAEAEARRAELREAERQLRERLMGIDSLFRTVLRDDPGTEGGTAG